MGLANALSHKDEINTSNDNQDLLPTLLFIKAVSVALTNKIAHSSPFDPLISAALYALDNGKSLLARASRHD